MLGSFTCAGALRCQAASQALMQSQRKAKLFPLQQTLFKAHLSRSSKDEDPSSTFLQHPCPPRLLNSTL